MDDQEKVELNPPSEQIIAYRALCLGALVMRGEFEQVVQKSEDSEVVEAHEDLIERLADWLVDEGVSQYLSPNEKRLFEKSAGSWTEQELIDASWRSEALGVILWTLSVLDSLPPYDTVFTQPEVINPLKLLGPTTEFLWRARLRPPEEVAKACDIADLWVWRSRIAAMQKGGLLLPEGWSFPQVIKTIAEKAHESGAISQLAEGDLPILGKPYTELSEDEYMHVTSIATERQLALDWVIGHAETWDQVTDGQFET